MTASGSARVTLVRANNPSPMTLDGTNTWVLVEPGAAGAVVIDPGPRDTAHADAIRAAVLRGGAARTALVLLTHTHADHAEGAREFAASDSAALRAALPSACVGADPLVDGERIEVDALGIDVVATPGHTADSVCFVLPAERELLTGDTILGQGSTVVAHPDGRLGDYLASLARLRALVEQRRIVRVLPGHGPVRDDPAQLIDGYLAHRQRRLRDVRAAIADGAGSVEELLRRIYGEVDPTLLFAARWSLLAQLEYLRERGELDNATTWLAGKALPDL